MANKDDLRKTGENPKAEKEVRRKFLDYFKSYKGDLGLGERVELLYQWLVHGKFKGHDRALLIGALFYFINPLDIVPDITPFVGFLDDAGVLTMAFRYLHSRAIEEAEFQKKISGKTED